MSVSHNQRYRYGSARWARKQDVHRADLFSPRGVPLAYWGERPLYLDSDAPIMTIGGAGSGKMRDILGRVVISCPRDRMMILDPRGEMASVSYHIHAAYQNAAWFWNPMGIVGLPRHSCNLLDILKRESPYFHADCKFVAESLIPLSGSANGQYFEIRARDWLAALLKFIVADYGSVTLPFLYEMICTIEGDTQRWAVQLSLMLQSQFQDVRRVASEILSKQQESQREFGSILGEIYANLSFLDDPQLCTALEGGDFSLKYLVHPKQVHKIFLNVPAEYLSLWAPVLRLFFTVASLYKSRHPQNPRVTLLIDEAGQLKKFETLIRAFTFGRGAGIRAWAIFQDIGQISRFYSRDILQSLLGSAQTRQFLGVRDYETAQLISNMLGTQSLEYIDPHQAHQHDSQAKKAFMSVFKGEDILGAAQQGLFHQKQGRIPNMQQRPLMTPAEILAMPEDRQILFISGKNIPPIYGHKHPYYTRPELAGKYLPNPWHPPLDRVPIMTKRGKQMRAIISEAPPTFLRHFPQYRTQPLRYVEGFNPYRRK